MSLKRSKGATPGFGSGWPDNWMSALFRRPPDETVHADDQEFDAALSGNTLLTVSGNATWTVGKSRLSVLFDGQTAADWSAQCWALTPSSAPITIEAAFRFGGEAQTNNIVGIGFSNGVVAGSTIASVYSYSPDTTTSAPYAPAPIYHIQTHGTFTEQTAADWQGDRMMQGAGLFYWRVIWSATNTFKGYFSFDGVSWTRFGGGDATVTLTPTHFFVGVSTWGDVDIGMATFEYLRVTEADLS